MSSEQVIALHRGALLLGTGASVVSGILWWISATVKVAISQEEFDRGDFTISDEIGGKRIDFIKTAQRQSRWNRYAAGASAVAALLLALATASS
ncbi:hypothetical protein [Asticcacaulis benevestitus]|uniref:Uncharacterized protein n=1 Tax=Asticcacaulis benevestitus DSM 16100 = ATCC BAA-896 TaxID=1121022 RepID=V4RRG8_9CAUL|nr:hypothetical protein [Asticcacaulis benevestitus]ESQ93773.1 hypothetical protein ABENE_05485 [Asticcacaulis benevestitus DSM 16100 = ATCC BAA-896]